MSHISAVDFRFDEAHFDTLAKDCEALGLELVRNATTYKWYGRDMGDYRDKTAGELGIVPDGKCSHKIRVKDADNSTYEIGLVADPQNAGKFIPVWDFWNGGHGLMKLVGDGEDINKLTHTHSLSVTRKTLRKKGLRWSESVGQDGRTRFKVTL